MGVVILAAEIVVGRNHSQIESIGDGDQKAPAERHDVRIEQTGESDRAALDRCGKPRLGEQRQVRKNLHLKLNRHVHAFLAVIQPTELSGEGDRRIAADDPKVKPWLKRERQRTEHESSVEAVVQAGHQRIEVAEVQATYQGELGGRFWSAEQEDGLGRTSL